LYCIPGSRAPHAISHVIGCCFFTPRSRWRHAERTCRRVAVTGTCPHPADSEWARVVPCLGFGPHSPIRAPPGLWHKPGCPPPTHPDRSTFGQLGRQRRLQPAEGATSAGSLDWDHTGWIPQGPKLRISKGGLLQTTHSGYRMAVARQ
jgi:hypothetical protein